jgi:hypothetical protein
MITFLTSEAEIRVSSSMTPSARLRSPTEAVKYTGRATATPCYVAIFKMDGSRVQTVDPTAQPCRAPWALAAQDPVDAPRGHRRRAVVVLQL